MRRRDGRLHGFTREIYAKLLQLLLNKELRVLAKARRLVLGVRNDAVAFGFARLHDFRAQFRKHVTTPLRLDTTQASHLYRIAQEGVNNAVRHGRATFITLRLVGDEDAVKLEIIDNGSGMPSPTQRSAVGMGLRIMEYRARMLGGEISILAPRRGGTAITCRVPLAVPRPVDDGQP